MNAIFNKSIQELEQRAVFWWPKHLSELETSTSIIPALLESQDKFLSILTIADENPFKVLEILRSSSFPANLFLKHLVVLSDFGGEQIQRLNKQFNSIFPQQEKSGENYFTFHWKGKDYKYGFKKIPIKANLNNDRLHIDGKNIVKSFPLDDIKEDLAIVLLFGSSALNDTTAENLRKCDIGTLIGSKDELEKYVKQKYIWVSRITGGAQANTLGQVAQTYAVNFLKQRLGHSYNVVRNGSIKIKGHTPIPFDTVVTKGNKQVGIELTFQVTTNSTIERKAGQSQARQELLHSAGSYIAYIIDGAGNFQRKSAISTICKHSDCTVAYSDEEFDTLALFIKEKLP